MMKGEEEWYGWWPGLFSLSKKIKEKIPVLWAVVGEGTAATIAMLFDVLEQKLVPFPSLPATYLIHTVAHFGESHSILSSLFVSSFSCPFEMGPNLRNQDDVKSK